MTKRLLLAVVMIFALMLAAAPFVAAAPPDSDRPPGWEHLPPDVGVKVFIHYIKGYGPADLELPIKPGNPAKPAKPGKPTPTPTQPPSPTPTPTPLPTTGCTGDAFNTALCDTYAYSRIRWATPANVQYRVKTAGSKVSPPSTFTDVLDIAFTKWDDLANGITYGYDSRVSTATPGVYDSENVIGWQKLQSGTIAVTYVWYSRAFRNILQFDMAFNTDYEWDYTEPSIPPSCGIETGFCDPDGSGAAGKFDLLNIATHEAGHTLMLDDLYDKTHPGTMDLTMFGYASYAQINKDTLGYGDIRGVRAIYP